MIASFKDKGTEDVFDGKDTKEARKACPQSVWNVARRKLDQINQSVSLDDSRSPPGNRLEKLSGDREGAHSVRINVKYRVCFEWIGEGAKEVEIVDYH
ncbi:MAG: type II toxin-antitoxin system RelE/ParE family toxin [Rubrobacter sp.]|nr:type II toxin-antitoxin system RelE/ParE family toxin [Rubrobacter sp.]